MLWHGGGNNLTEEEFIDEIEVLFESRLIEINGLEQGTFKEFQFNIPHWIKKLVYFWDESSISEQEFLNAIKYILESQMPKYSSYE